MRTISVMVSAILFAVSILLSHGTDRRAPAAMAATTDVRQTHSGDTIRMLTHRPISTTTPPRVVRAGLLKLGTGAAEYRLYPRRNPTAVALRP